MTVKYLDLGIRDRSVQGIIHLFGPDIESDFLFNFNFIKLTFGFLQNAHEFPISGDKSFH